MLGKYFFFFLQLVAQQMHTSVDLSPLRFITTAANQGHVGVDAYTKQIGGE